jgi:hypothetical protein
MQYLWGVVLAVAGPGWLWWITLALAYFFGIGFYNDYPVARDWAKEVLGVILPENFQLWWIVVPFLLWVIARLAHREAMARLRAARIIFDEPYIDAFVPLWHRGTGQLVGENDIAKIRVRNVPFDGSRGLVVTDAYAFIEFYNATSLQLVLRFDYPRWQENPMPAYGTNPGDHIVDEWNRRNLSPTGEAATLNFLVKTRSEGRAYGFRTRSQLLPLWHDRELELRSGNYLAKLTVAGVNLRRPAEQWLSVSVGGVDESLRVEKSTKPETKWW